MSFEQSFQYLLGWEGGYGNAKHDDGGPTNLGVVQVEYDAYRKRKGLLPQSVKYITRAEAQEIYKNEYWDATGCDHLNEGLANAVFDAGVNSGDKRGVEWLQKAINQVCGHSYVQVDGKIGDATIAAANQLPADKLIDALLDIRLAFMKVCRNKEGELLWPTFGRGWNARIAGVRGQSHKLADAEPPQVTYHPAPKVDPTIGEPSMSATSSPAVNSNPVVAAAVKAATAPIKSIWTSITGVVSSVAGGAVATVLTTLAPNLTGEIIGAAGIAFALVNTAAHIYALVSGQIATNNATIALAENLLNDAVQALGQKPYTFDNSPTSAPAAS